jgi:mRNA-degrading endonuclease YafQ of YafQ-DinJ toxin-antitoxin module
MKLSQTAQFKKDVKRQLRQGKNQAKLVEVVQILLTGSDAPFAIRSSLARRTSAC